MPRLFVNSAAVHGGQAEIGGDAAQHLAGSLRIRPGDTIAVVDELAMEYTVQVASATTRLVTGTVLATRAAGGEPRLQIAILQALAKDGMDQAIDAMVQAGASAIYPVLTERTVARPEPGRALQRVQRWQAIARETAQLAYRARIPSVHDLSELGTAIASLPASGRLLVGVLDGAAQPLAAMRFDLAQPVALCIGPEGGLGPRDLALLREHGAEPVRLGARVWRSRLAAALAITALLGHCGDLDASTDAPDPALLAAQQ